MTHTPVFAEIKIMVDVTQLSTDVKAALAKLEELVAGQQQLTDRITALEAADASTQAEVNALDQQVQGALTPPAPDPAPEPAPAPVDPAPEPAPAPAP